MTTAQVETSPIQREIEQLGRNVGEVGQSRHQSGVQDLGTRNTKRTTCETLGKHLDSMVWLLQNFRMDTLSPISFN